MNSYFLNKIKNKVSKDLLWKIKFYKYFGKLPDLDNPTFFNEKVKYRMKFDRNYIYTKLADKYLVRKYISEKIGAEYLVPLRYVLDSENDINVELNLDNCVMKANHGAGMVKIINGKFDYKKINELKVLASSWLSTDFSKKFNETHYKNIPRKILFEESLCSDGVVPNDYKFHIFKKKNGDFNFVLQVVNGRFGTESRGYYLNGLTLKELVWYHGSGNHFIPEKHISRLSEAIPLSIKLCEDFSYIRVDWYVTDFNIFFGELTFTPGAAGGFEFGEELEKKMASFWEL